MIKKSIYTMFLLLLCLNVAAQSTMSDDQVLQYVVTQSQKGVSQQQMAKELLQKGVSAAQLQRVKRKAEQLKNSSSTITNPKASGFQSRTIDPATVQRPTDVEADAKVAQQGALPADMVEPMPEEEPKPKVFGRDIFSSKNLSFQPSANMATPVNYQLGPGDEIVLNIWGASQQTITQELSPDGLIVVEGSGPIKLGGLTISQAKALLQDVLGSHYADCRFDLSLGNVRSIQVQVMGEVLSPGTYTLSGLSSAFNALYMAGGISDIGTLRAIKVYRSGRLISTIDVYDYIINGNVRGDVRLQDEDVIVVGPYECLVDVQGSVKRPMIYEMKGAESVKDLLTYSGGFAGNAYKQNVRLKRKSGSEYSIHTIDEFQMGAFQLSDGDEVVVDSVRPRFSNLVDVRGAVKHPGQFQLGGSIQTVRELLLAADGLSEDAYEDHAVIHREKDDMTLEMIAVNVGGIIKGETPDIPLRNNDVLFVPSKLEMLGDRMLTISGEVAYEGEYPYADNTTLKDLIVQAGGIKDAGSLAHVNVYRRVRDIFAMEDNNECAESFTFSLDENYNILRDTVFYLKPYDVVFIRKSPAYEEQQFVTVRGSVNFVGNYTLTNKNYRVSDLIRDCGGVNSLAYLRGARLTRRMNEDEKLQRDNAFKHAQIQLYEQALKEGKDANRELADTLLSMKMNQDDTYPVALELEAAMKNPGGEHDIVLRGGDVITVPQFSNIVKVSGEVAYAISMNYQKGKSLSYYIKHAGGYSSRAKRNGVYAVYANGGVEKVGKRSSKDIQPGCEIVVPAKEQKNKMTTGEIIGISTGTASLASVLVALISIFK